MRIELEFSSSSSCRMLYGCFDGPRKPILCLELYVQEVTLTVR